MSTKAKFVPRDAALAVALILDAEKHRQEMTQGQLASAVGISQPQVSHALRGLKPMTMTEMFRMCTALGLDASDVVAQAQRQTLSR